MSMFQKIVFFGLKFSLNLEYEAKGFIHKKIFSVEFRVFPEACRASLIYSTRNFKRVFLETRFFQNGTHHNSNNFQYFLFKFQPHISNNIFKRNTYGFFDKLIWTISINKWLASFSSKNDVFSSNTCQFYKKKKNNIFTNPYVFL